MNGGDIEVRGGGNAVLIQQSESLRERLDRAVDTVSTCATYFN